MLVFSRANFEAHAPVSIKQLIPDTHREMLDGKPVLLRDDGYGHVEYAVDGEPYYLYPVYPGWCEEVNDADD